MTQSKIFPALRGARFTALVALIALGFLFTVSGAKADGCANLNKAAAAPSAPFVGPRSGAHPQAEDEMNGHASIVGLWHLIYTAETESGAPIFPPAPFQFAETFKTWHADGTEFEQRVFPPRAETSASGSGRTQATAASSCTISV